MHEHRLLCTDTGAASLPSIVPPALHRVAGAEPCSSGYTETRTSYTAAALPVSPSSGRVKILRFDNITEARLFRHYVHKVSTWIDICDRECHFGIEVPRRAHQSRLLCCSILAFASAFSGSPARSVAYHGEAVDILIPILDGPVESLDENVLAAIILLRAFEEGTDTDTATHLYGGARLLDTASGFAAAGGLGEAASWIMLRQSIYVSFTRSRPLRLNLNSYRRSSAFTGVDAESFANRAVFLCAQVLVFAFGTGQDAPEWRLDEWHSLEEDLEQWYRTRPKELCAYWVNTPLFEQGAETAPAFPTTCMTRPVHVFNPRLMEPSFDTIVRRREADDQILNSLRMVIGLAISHPSNITAGFHARHVLQACGSYLKDPKEQQEALAFLKNIEAETRWKASHIAHDLRRVWSKTASEMTTRFCDFTV
ncbi:hypothetical protein NPX13_g987 [Xylaria arbuscula]|uniref:Transcription factor domain-containing protein n=1 Tax=Xylaria arbuscula TaxID=114810 RepID=A0A9W8TQ15_9PEZI|nr:hypothetical protein NPX13_g987 [Xylaria arbuscula]